MVEKVCKRLLAENQEINLENPFTKDDVAFASTDEDGEKIGIAYKPWQLIEDVINAYNEFNSSKDPRIKISPKAFSSKSARALARAIDKSMIAYISISEPSTSAKCNDAWEVNFSAGPGQGKLTYAMGYHLSPSGRLIPDRKSLSDDAVNSWKKVRSKSEGIPLDDQDHNSDQFHDKYHTEDPSDDCLTYPVKSRGSEKKGKVNKRTDGIDFETADAVNRSYEMGDMGYDFDLMSSIHESTIEKIKTFGFERETFMDFLVSSSSMFFSKNYRKNLET